MSVEKDNSLDTLQEIRSMMERSARFLSLSGWSGVWAGVVALVGAGVAHKLVSSHSSDGSHFDNYNEAAQSQFRYQVSTLDFLLFAVLVFSVAFIGGFYFTYRKNKKDGIKIWNSASRKMVINLAIPLLAGAATVLAFVLKGDWMYVAPVCLIFYGLALINGSKYTVSDIKYLGLLEVVLGCLGLFISPGYGLYLWAAGFGVLHIVYGIIMWRKYDK